MNMLPANGKNNRRLLLRFGKKGIKAMYTGNLYMGGSVNEQVF